MKHQGAKESLQKFTKSFEEMKIDNSGKCYSLMDKSLVHQNGILLAYKGPFSIHILSNFGSYIKHFGSNLLTQNKLYKIFFELAQNVGRYSADRMLVEENKDIGVGVFMLESFDHALKLSTTNIILKEQGPILLDYCTKINAMSKNDLRLLKSVKRNSDDHQSNSAHIGIIQVGILSSNKIDCTIENIDTKYSRFSIGTTINKFYA